MKILSSDLTYFGDVDLYFEVVVNFLLFSNIYRIYVCFFLNFLKISVGLNFILECKDPN